MSRKLYFCDQINDERCYTLSALKEMAADEELEEITVILAQRDTGTDYFFCKHYEFAGDKTEGNCGKLCDQYRPRNGKSGRCRHSNWCYEPVGEKITVKIKQEGVK